MKKKMLFFGYFQFFLVILLPAGAGLSAVFGYTFELASYSLFAILTALMSVYTAILSTKHIECAESKGIRVLFSLLAPLSLINAVFYMLECRIIWVIVSVFTCVGCCCYLTVRYGKPLALKIVAWILFAVMILPVGYFGFLSLIFGGIGKNTVVKTVTSPSGTFYAEVTDSDQGALGGDTLVDVYKKSGINVLLFKIVKKPQRVYVGDWGEFEDMQIYWKDDRCLVINSSEYEIE